MNRNGFRALLKAKGFNDFTEKMIMKAYGYAKAGHRNQEREVSEEKPLPPDQSRYFNHPKRMAINLIKDGCNDYKTIIVALLHDSVEDTSLFCNLKTDGYEIAISDAHFNISTSFDEEIARDIISLTEPKVNTLVKEFSSKKLCLNFYKKNMLTASKRAILVKLIDRIDNMQTVEVKSKRTAELKIEETNEFYIPLFHRTFDNNPSDFSLFYGSEKTLELEELIAEKAKLVAEMK